MRNLAQSSGVGHWRRAWRRPEARWGLLFALPVLLLFVVLRIIPAIIAMFLSFTEYNMLKSPVWVGFANYLTLFEDKVFWKAVANTALYTAGVVIPGTILALAIALMLDQKLRGLTFYRVAFYTPVVASFVTVSMIWVYMYNPQFGVINYMLSLVGIPKQGWLDSPDLALISVIIVGIWKNLGYNTIVFLAGLQSIPEHLYEAAVVDGAGAWRRFWHITVPLLTPTTVFVVLMSTIFGLQAFDQIEVLTHGGPANATTTVVYLAYRSAFEYMKMGEASAMAVLLLGLITSAVWIILRISRFASVNK